MLPAEAYTSADVLAWEQRHFFAGSWACAGREIELRSDSGGKPVTQRAISVGDITVLLIWAPGDGGIRAFANTCRHRGHEILPAGCTSTKRALMCPYHAWTYSLDGGLMGAPGFRDMDGFDPAEHGLVELPVTVWHGWVFVNATGTGPPFRDHIGALENFVAPYAPEGLIHLAQHDYEVAANWKVVVENYHECYHCPLIHPELCQVSPPNSGENFDLPGAWVGGSMDLREGAVTMSLDGTSAGIPIPAVDPRQVFYLGLFPNLLISLHPDYVMTHRLRPLLDWRTSSIRTRASCSATDTCCNCWRSLGALRWHWRSAAGRTHPHHNMRNRRWLRSTGIGRRTSLPEASLPSLFSNVGSDVRYRWHFPPWPQLSESSHYDA